MPTIRTVTATGIVAATLGVAGAIVETTGRQTATATVASRSKYIDDIRAQLRALTRDDAA